MCIPIHDPSNALHRLPPQDQNAAEWAAKVAAFYARHAKRQVSDDDDDGSCRVCGDTCDSEHPCYHCGTSGRDNSLGEERDREEEWWERYDRSQRDD